MTATFMNIFNVPTALKFQLLMITRSLDVTQKPVISQTFKHILITNKMHMCE